MLTSPLKDPSSSVVCLSKSQLNLQHSDQCESLISLTSSASITTSGTSVVAAGPGAGEPARPLSDSAVLVFGVSVDMVENEVVAGITDQMLGKE